MNQKDGPVILVAEDDPDDRLLSKEALKFGGIDAVVLFVEDGVELMDYLHSLSKNGNHNPWPDLILLDIKMPRKSGWEALEEIKAEPSLSKILIIILTTSRNMDDVVRSKELGAEAYYTKPASFEELIDIMRDIGRLWKEKSDLKQ